MCLGIEDTFRTAATEVSLLAGSEEFNATKLFEVGKKVLFLYYLNIDLVFWRFFLPTISSLDPCKYFVFPFWGQFPQHISCTRSSSSTQYCLHFLICKMI